MIDASPSGPLPNHPRLRRAIGDTLRTLVAAPPSRACLNAMYRRLSSAHRAAAHRRFAGIFRTHSIRFKGGTWTVPFAGRTIAIPLREELLGLDWDVALGVLGHDVEVKDTYAAMLAGPNRPDVFVDVGTNLGVHSLIFLVHGVATLSFEPNVECHPFFAALCAANGVSSSLEPVALGAELGYVELEYPEQETWLGSTNEAVREQLRRTMTMRRARVEQRTLDQFLPGLIGKRVLIKLDTEGNEAQVLAGARAVLRACRPWVLFESWRERPEREALWDVIASAGMRIFALPYIVDRRREPLSMAAFGTSDATNFIAVPGGAR